MTPIVGIACIFLALLESFAMVVRHILSDSNEKQHMQLLPGENAVDIIDISSIENWDLLRYKYVERGIPIVLRSGATFQVQ